MIINPKNGEFFLGKLILNPNYTVKDLMKIEEKNILVQSETYPAVKRFLINPVQIGNDYFIASLYFNNDDRLWFVDFAILDSEELPSWDHWSFEKEMEIKKHHDEWLENHLGDPPYQYDWGKITSDYDPRSASSTIVITYSQIIK